MRAWLVVCCLYGVAGGSAWGRVVLTPDQAQLLIATCPAVRVLDVREPGEFCTDTGHIAGAWNLPWLSGRLEARVDDLPRDRPLLVHCQSGGRSRAAATFLDARGFVLVFDMAGGMNAWTGPTVRCADTDGDGVDNDRDTCPCDVDPNQADANRDGLGDACDPADPNVVMDHLGITVAQTVELLASRLPVTILDVREPSEFCGPFGHLAGARNLPYWSGVLEARLAEIPRDRILLVHCQSGGRSRRAAELLDAAGFPHVFDMLGGMNAWTGPTVTCSDPTPAP